MTTLERTKEEYGGFMPLELNEGNELFKIYEPNLLRFNSVKAAIHFLIMKLLPKRICLPYYYCPSTTNAIRQLGIEVTFYHIDEELLPLNLFDEDGCLILLVDYFGVRSERVDDIAKTFEKAEVIVDKAHDFFSEPILGKNVHNIYSAKKFFGIPDGAYIVSELVKEESTPFSYSVEYAGYLLKTYEKGTNGAYFDKKKADETIASDYLGMSKLAYGLLQNVDYRFVETRRRENYSFLQRHFISVNLLSLPTNVPAYQFPLLVEKNGKLIKKKLIENRIYVSTLWNGNDLLNNGSDWELFLAENTVFLPVDQRYHEKDMLYLAQITDRLIQTI